MHEKISKCEKCLRQKMRSTGFPFSLIGVWGRGEGGEFKYWRRELRLKIGFNFNNRVNIS